MLTIQHVLCIVCCQVLQTVPYAPPRFMPFYTCIRPQGQPAPAPSAPKAIVLTKEHTALVERQRIEKAGGAVVDGRLAGRMQVSRSFGDPALKKVRGTGSRMQ